MKIVKRIIVPVLALVLVVVAALNIIKLIANSKLTEKKETSHFTFYCSKQEEYLLADLPDILERSYGKVSNDLKVKLEDRIVVRIYPDPQSYRQSFGNPLPWPGQVGGGSGNGSITVVSPKYLPGYLNIENVLVHEMTHQIKDRINPSVKGGWLSEGIASFEGNEMPGSWISSQMSNEIKAGGIPTFDELDKYTYQQWVNEQGYVFAYSIIEFIVEEYGYDKLIEMVKTPDDYKNVFNLSKDEFYSKWLEFIKEKYSV